MKTKEPYILTNEDIYNWSPSDAVYNRGNDYYFEGLVSDLEFHPSTNEWTAIVEGSDWYDVSIEIRDGANILTYCDCPAYETYGACKHCVAVLLEIGEKTANQAYAERRTQNKGDTFTNTRDYHVTNRLIQSFSTRHQPTTIAKPVSNKKQPLTVEFHCKATSKRYIGYGNYLAVEMKVGVNRTYVVRSIGDFLERIINEDSHEFTKKFSYDPTEHHFIDEDMEIIKLLYYAFENEGFLRDQQQFSHWRQPSRNERYLTIPPFMAERFLQLVQERKVTMEALDKIYPTIEVQDAGTLPFSFNFEKKTASVFELDLKDLKNASLFDNYHYLFQNGVFYKLKPAQLELLSDFLDIQDTVNKSSISIHQEQIEPFLSHVIPGLKKVANINIAENISDQLIQHPLKAKLYLDLNEEDLIAKLEYHYGEIVIGPFHQEGSNQTEFILIRDVEKEQIIMNILEHTALKYNGQNFYIEGEEELYEFLYHAIPRLEEYAGIYMTGAIKSMILEENQTPSASIDIESGGDLLEISFNMDGIDPNEVQAILQSLVEKKKYYRLPDGAFVSLEGESIQTIDNLITELNTSQSELNDGKMQVPLYRGFQIDEMLNSGGHQDTAAKVSRKFQRLIQDIKNPELIDFTIPNSLNATLRDYQQVGFQWLKSLAHYRMGGILADDMGLGKTLQSIAYLLSEQKEREGEARKPSLIVAPASLVYNWNTEFEKFAPEMKVEVVYGTPNERTNIIKDGQADVYITSYPSLRQDLNLYKKISFDSMILDEAQAIKNHATKSAKAVKQIQAGKKFALSGTPIENSLDELWSIFDAILPGFFPNQKTFRGLPQEKVARMVRPFLLRRLKKDVLKELPDKIESVHYSELTHKQKELYVGYLDRIQSETKATLQQEGFNNSRMQILAALTRLRQLCCHPSLFLENFEGNSGKLDQLKELIMNAMENKKRLLIFSQFTSILELIRKELDDLGLGYFYLDGQTPSKERVQMTERFNDGEHNIFLISLKAGGTGLNLTGADTVVLYDLWWNPAIEEQAAGRAHRIGQKQVVQVMRMITKGTIEEKIYQLQQKKKELIEKVIQPGESMLARLSEDDIREILDI
ncbi:DEAD/DEAH box helicase [Pseudalkalibacillus decolorationis]|uniref:DEAD/DEAH box helicase n=1 Tax=Pseudalkalibacillus decolorationis TaxID=163879 RepID=UPI00214850AC|nr:DEAD/DEAH box helicase [Pseudalkalibacillus decolorationis]